MTVCSEESVVFEVSPASGSVSGLVQMPRGAWAFFVFAHGAGAGMRHPFMTDVASVLCDAGVGTLRYQFPFAEAGRKRPDASAVAQATVRSAVSEAAIVAPGLPLFAGGKSFGGRMTSSLASTEPLRAVSGIVFLGFPLHAPGRGSTGRADHLTSVDVPMLFVQGTRDRLSEESLIRAVCSRPGIRATLHVVEGGDHSFGVLKRSGRTRAEVIDEICSTLAGWMRRVVD